MKVVIIEDEKPSARHLKNLLQKIDNTIEVIKYLDTVKSTIDYFDCDVNRFISGGYKDWDWD